MAVDRVEVLSASTGSATHAPASEASDSYDHAQYGSPSHAAGDVSLFDSHALAATARAAKAGMPSADLAAATGDGAQNEAEENEGESSPDPPESDDDASTHAHSASRPIFPSAHADSPRGVRARHVEARSRSSTIAGSTFARGPTRHRWRMRTPQAALGTHASAPNAVARAHVAEAASQEPASAPAAAHVSSPATTSARKVAPGECTRWCDATKRAEGTQRDADALQKHARESETDADADARARTHVSANTATRKRCARAISPPESDEDGTRGAKWARGGEETDRREIPRRNDKCENYGGGPRAQRATNVVVENISECWPSSPSSRRAPRSSSHAHHRRVRAPHAAAPVVRERHDAREVRVRARRHLGPHAGGPLPPRGARQGRVPRQARVFRGAALLAGGDGGVPAGPGRRALPQQPHEPNGHGKHARARARARVRPLQVRGSRAERARAAIDRSGRAFPRSPTRNAAPRRASLTPLRSRLRLPPRVALPPPQEQGHRLVGREAARVQRGSRE